MSANQKFVAAGAVLLTAAAICISAAVTHSIMLSGARPSITVVGSCAATNNGGTLHLDSSGFTPNAPYLTQVWHNGKNYLDVWGYSDAYGEASGWHWPCDEESKPGSYTVRILDDETGKLSNRTSFVIEAPPKS